MIDDEIMSGNESNEDREEVDAFIKARIKQGSGKDYDSLVKRDIVNYRKVHGKDDYAEINKYESSK